MRGFFPYKLGTGLRSTPLSRCPAEGSINLPFNQPHCATVPDTTAPHIHWGQGRETPNLAEPSPGAGAHTGASLISKN